MEKVAGEKKAIDEQEKAAAAKLAKKELAERTEMCAK